MARIWKQRSSNQIAFALCLALLCAGCSTTPSGPQPASRVILLWMKRPESAPDRAQLVRAATSLRMMPGVTRVETGRAVPPPSAETDRSYDLAVMITYRDRAALARSAQDPRQTRALDRYLRPLVSRYAIHNLDSR